MSWFLPDDGDVLDGAPTGRTILLGGLSPLTLPDALMAPCLSSGRGEACGVSGLPHHPVNSQVDGGELEEYISRQICT